MNDSKARPPVKPVHAAILLVIAAASLLAAVWFYRDTGRHTVTDVDAEQFEKPLYTGEIIDAEATEDLTVHEGWRYRVKIEDVSRSGSAGVAFLGGLVTFVPEAQPGQTAIIEIIRVRERTAGARLLEIVEAGSVETAEQSAPADRDESAAARETYADAPDDGLRIGGTYTGMVVDVGSRGDGIVKLEGKVIFVDESQIGCKVVYRVLDDRGRYANGEVIASDCPEPPAPGEVLDGGTATAEQVLPGQQFRVEITEKDRRTPDTDGVTRIGGLVVFVPGTQPGDECVIEIFERAERFAKSRVIEESD